MNLRELLSVREDGQACARGALRCGGTAWAHLAAVANAVPGSRSGGACPPRPDGGCRVSAGAGTQGGGRCLRQERGPRLRRASPSPCRPLGERPAEHPLTRSFVLQTRGVRVDKRGEAPRRLLRARSPGKRGRRAAPAAQPDCWRGGHPTRDTPGRSPAFPPPSPRWHRRPEGKPRRAGGVWEASSVSFPRRVCGRSARRPVSPQDAGGPGRLLSAPWMQICVPPSVSDGTGPG